VRARDDEEETRVTCDAITARVRRRTNIARNGNDDKEDDADATSSSHRR
jgi:hypothetical protein